MLWLRHQTVHDMLPIVSSDLKSVRNFPSYDPVKLPNKHIFQISFQFVFNFSNFLISSCEMNSPQKNKLFTYKFLFLIQKLSKMSHSLHEQYIKIYGRTDRHWFCSNDCTIKFKMAATDSFYWIQTYIIL